MLLLLLLLLLYDIRSTVHYTVVQDGFDECKNCRLTVKRGLKWTAEDMYPIIAQDTHGVLALGADNVRELETFGRISLRQSNFRRTVDVNLYRRRWCPIHASYREFRRMA